VSDNSPAGGYPRTLPLIFAFYEFLLTAVLLFAVVTVVRWLRYPASHAYIASLRPALGAIAAITAVLLVALISSPLGRRSGGHMNPAVTIAVWLMDVFPGASVVPYIVAQLAGSVVGVALGRLVWGAPVSAPAISYTALGPEPGVGPATVYLGECGCMIALIGLVGHFLAYPAYNRWLPETIGVAVGGIIFGLGPVTGGVVNPARQFGPAAWAGQTLDLWIYLTAPVVGAVLGAGLHHLLYRRFKLRQPLTYQLAGPRTEPRRNPQSSHAPCR
jgi:glycerol uptake facilitator-like aquaporin